jgi:sugar lactone lactonase YvrE
MDAAPVSDGAVMPTDAAPAPDGGPSVDAEADAGAEADASADAGLADVGQGLVCPPSPLSAGTPFSGRIFAAKSYPGTSLPVYEVTTGTRTAPSQFALLSAAAFVGPLLITADGHFYAATDANSGSLYDITAGGDLTAAAPIAAHLFNPVGAPEGMAIDADGNFYLSNSETATTAQIARVTRTGSVTYLPHRFSNATGIVFCGRKLAIAEGGKGRIILHDTATGAEEIWATGFQPGNDHISGQLAVDRGGHLLALWTTSIGPGLFDLTTGGDFTGRAPIVPATFRIDVNQIAISADDSIYAAGNNTGNIYVSRFAAGAHQPFVLFVSGIGDTESVAVGP